MVDRERQRYRGAIEELLESCERKNIKVEFVGVDVLQDYIGMNSQAARAMGFKMPPDTIYVGKSLDAVLKYKTLKHEMVEMGLMEEGKQYWPAHLVALRKEQIKPRKRLKIQRRKYYPPVVTLAGMRG